MARSKRISFEVIAISDRGTVLCSGGSSPTEYEALQKVPQVLSESPNATAWEIIKVVKEVIRTGSGSPSNKDLLTTRHR